MRLELTLEVKKILISIFSTTVSIFAFSQSQSPGNVSTDLYLWLKADNGVTTTGSNVSSWTNQSATVMTTDASKAATSNVTLNTNSFNYNPTVIFDGASSQNLAGQFQTAPSSAPVLFSVSKSLSSQTGCCSGPLHLGPGGSYGISYGYVWHSSSGYEATQDSYSADSNGGGGSASTTQTVDMPFIINLKYVSQNLLDAVVTANGISGTTAGAAAVETPDGTFQVGGRTYGGSSNRIFHGYIPEVIYYNSSLTSDEISRIETYLAVKYGVTLSHDYLNTSSATIYSPSGSFGNGIIGIGRDDNELLYQKQSHDIDDATRVYISTLSSSNAINAGTFSTDNQYVIMGHDNTSLNSTGSTEFPAGQGIYSRINREWKITNTNFGGTFSIDVKLSTTPIDPSDLRVLIDLDGNFTNATMISPTISYASGVVTISGLSTTNIPTNSTRFMTIASLSSPTPLPIELLDFNASLIDNRSVKLHWQTASEINNDYFTIERSNNGIEWKGLKNIDGAGNSSSVLIYDEIDYEPFTGVSYYRLKQTDFDGEFLYSGIRNVKIENRINYSIKIYPNPTSNEVTIIGNTLELEQIKVFNTLGQDISIFTTIKESNEGEIIIDLSNLTSGIYYIRTKTTTNKVYKQ
jgi:hypothetical protein